jgi:hypothetical protein
MTTYTATQRRNIARAFQLALEELPDTAGAFLYNDSPFICDNIYRSICSDTADLACSVIAKRIDYSFSLERWLKEQSWELREEVVADLAYNSGRKLQAHRKAWLKQLIKEFGGTV